MKQRALLLIFLINLSLSTFAFGPVGHQIVADIAYNNLKRSTKKKVDNLLGKRGIIYTSSWADEIKSNEKYEYSYDWHFQNLRADMTRDELQHLYNNPGLEGDFLFFALDSLSNVLKKDKNNDEALKFIVHFLGDIHQPLHLGRLEDRGGNDIPVRWFGRDIRLHQLWDTQILESQRFSYSEYSQYLQDKFGKRKNEFKKQSLFDSVWETYLLQLQIYDYNYEDLNPYDYQYHFGDDIDEQLFRAGIQLANLLNRIM